MENQEDPKKYFDEKQYITKIVGNENEAEPEEQGTDKVSLLISLLTDPKNKEFKEEALLTLKKEKGGHLLLAAVLKTKDPVKKQQLLAACWESEIDFTSHLPFFIDVAITGDYLTALEAITIVQNMEGTFDQQHVKQAIEKIKQHKKNIQSELLVLFNDLEMFLNDQLQ